MPAPKPVLPQKTMPPSEEMLKCSPHFSSSFSVKGRQISSRQVDTRLMALSGLKPGFDAYQVAKGAEQIAGAVWNPAMENIATKSVEMVAESIPGGRLPQLTCR